jgi:hypothetical protein
MSFRLAIINASVRSTLDCGGSTPLFSPDLFIPKGLGRFQGGVEPPHSKVLRTAVFTRAGVPRTCLVGPNGVRPLEFSHFSRGAVLGEWPARGWNIGNPQVSVVSQFKLSATILAAPRPLEAGATLQIRTLPAPRFLPVGKVKPICIFLPTGRKNGPEFC